MTLTSVLRTIILYGLFISPIVPFIVVNSFFFPFITGKAFFFRILIEIIFAAWIILMIKEPAYRPKKSWLFYAMTAFIVIIAIADIFGVHFTRSFWSNFERMEGLITLLHFYAYFLMLATVLNTQKLWNYFLNTTLGANAVLCLFYGLPQAIGKAEIHQSSDRVDATLGNATYFAVYLLMHIFIAFYLMLKTRNLYARYAYGVSILLQFFLLYKTQTRGAMLGLIGGLFIYAVIAAIFEKERKIVRRISIAILIGLVVIIGGFYMVKDSQFVKESPTLKRFADLSLSREFLQGQGRFYVWPMAFEAAKERPILGWGQDNFNYVFNEHYNPKMWSQEQWFDRTHNVVLDWLVSGGILGLVSYLLIFIALLYYIWFGKGGNFALSDKSLLTGLLAAYFFQNLFVFDNLVSYMLFATIAAYIYALRTPEDKKPLLASTTVSEGTSTRVVTPIVIIVMITLLYTGTIRPMLANAALLQAVAPESDGKNDYMKDIESFKKALAYDTFGTAEAREHLVLLAQRVSSSPTSEEMLQAAFEAASTEMETQIRENPRPDARYYLFIGVLYARFNMLDKALEQLMKAHELSPKKQTIIFEIANVYFLQNNTTEALKYAKLAFDLDQSFTDARIRYAIFLVPSGQLELARELLKPLDVTVEHSDGTIENPYLLDDRILGAFMRAKQFDIAIDILTRRLALNPLNPQYHVSLAAAYFEMGNTAKAVEIVEDFIALDPVKYKAQGEAFIKQIQEGNVEQ